MPTDPLDLVVRGIEHLGDRLDKTNSILEENTASLRYHIKRTDELEAFVKAQAKVSERRFKVLEVSRERVLGALKLFSVVSSVAGGIFAMLKLWKLH